MLENVKNRVVERSNGYMEKDMSMSHEGLGNNVPLTCVCGRVDMQLLSDHQADGVGVCLCAKKKPKSLCVLCYASEIAVRLMVHQAVSNTQQSPV
jgi:hypothetical protein